MGTVRKAAECATVGVVAVGALSCALYLRYARGAEAREWITRSLGYEWRAALEHLLSGIGAPLTLLVVVAVIYVVAAGLARALCEVFGRNEEDPLQAVGLLRASMVLALLYCGYSLSWEIMQARVGAYGAPARGYVQFEQLMADLLGSVLGVLAVGWLIGRRAQTPRVA